MLREGRNKTNEVINICGFMFQNLLQGVSLSLWKETQEGNQPIDINRSKQIKTCTISNIVIIINIHVVIIVYTICVCV